MIERQSCYEQIQSAYHKLIRIDVSTDSDDPSNLINVIESYALNPKVYFYYFELIELIFDWFLLKFRKRIQVTNRNRLLANRERLVTEVF